MNLAGSVRLVYRLNGRDRNIVPLPKSQYDKYIWNKPA